ASFAAGAASAHDKLTERNLEISNYWVRASLGTVPTTAGYLAIRSTDGKPDKLLSAASPAAEKVELHTHMMKDGIAMMRPVPAIDVPADKPVELKQGGYHLMFLKVKSPLKVGDTVKVTFTFQRAGAVTVSMPVQTGPAMDHMHH
ncbi:MAG: copper chaperone PCu(A)C, partial [Rhodospirillaceae bacterium]|nr:copper chaperone PCu(A)C [Rhodospirillaceae bacterium]